MIRSNINAPIYLAIVFMLAALLSALAVPAEAAEVSFSLTCAPPTTRADDPPLALSELGKECRIYHRINGELLRPRSAPPLWMVASPSAASMRSTRPARFVWRFPRQCRTGSGPESGKLHRRQHAVPVWMRVVQGIHPAGSAVFYDLRFETVELTEAMI